MSHSCCHLSFSVSAGDALETTLAAFGEAAGQRLADEVRLPLTLGAVPDAAGLTRLVERMAECLFEAMQGQTPSTQVAGLLRLAPLSGARAPDAVCFSGGVSEYIGIHTHSELKLPNAVVSIDDIVLHEFDFIDIGALLDTSGAVPVVIKSLVFPQTAALGRNAVRSLR